jgi:hypothetical protein
MMQALAQAMAPYMPGAVSKASGTPITTYLYEEGGLFGTCKNDPVLINAMVGPTGYEKKLQFFGTDSENPIVESLTYISSSGYAQATSCGDCGTPTIRRCAQTSCFERICQQTDEMLFDDIGLRANNNVPTLALFGNITDPAGNVILGQGDQVTNMFTLQLAAVAYNLRRQIGVDIWTGNPAANAGGRNFMTGFDLLINTGKSDALTGVACDALDSIINNYANNIVGAAGSPSIVQRVSGIVRSILYRIQSAGFGSDGAVIDIVMHPTLWDCVADAWACEYGLQCQSWTATSQRQMTNDALAVADLRDTFKSNMYLTIDGRNYPVTLDNGISVTNRPVGNSTARCSSIYVITRNLPGAPNGGVITYGEFQNMQQTAGDVIGWFRSTFGATIVDVTDGGRFAVAPMTSGGFCFDVKVLSKPRIRMLMPQLAGRVTNVCCIPTGTYPDVTGSGGVYAVDGGPVFTPPNYLYGDCWPLAVGDPTNPR